MVSIWVCEIARLGRAGYFDPTTHNKPIDVGSRGKCMVMVYQCHPLNPT